MKSDLIVCSEMGLLPRVFQIVSEALINTVDILGYKTKLWIEINKRLDYKLCEH